MRSFQIMLQATHGVVSGNPSFFMRAYGEDSRAFEHLLSLPHAFIFHREYYEHGKGHAQRDEYEALRRRLSPSQERDLVEILSGPVTTGSRREHYRSLLVDRSIAPLIRRIIEFHTLGIMDVSKEQTHQILPLFPHLNPDPVMPEKG